MRKLITVKNDEHNILHTKRRELSPDFPDTKNALQHCYFERQAQGSSRCCGIAAPQIGSNCRVFYVDFRDKDTRKRVIRSVINPLVLSLSEKTFTHTEGCMSIPDVFLKVERHERITLSYYCPNQKKRIEETFHGFSAAVFQHEIDHLNGILITDKSEA